MKTGQQEFLNRTLTTFADQGREQQKLIQDTIAHARAKGIPAARFEFQMLYGLRKGRWEELVRDGWNVRVYVVPFGTHWIPYFYRRLRERKENVLFVLRNLFR